MSDPRKHRLLRWLGRGVLGLLVLILAAALGAALWVRGRLRADLPQDDGDRKVAGLRGPATIARDRQGVPSIRAGSRLDAAFATGFAHASDRYFQMDLTRRRAAGELAELLGPAALAADRPVRRNRFRAQAQRIFARLPPEQRELLEAYARGANAGLAALGEKPFEYLLLRTRPAAWKAEDSLLVLDAMFLMLQDGRGRRESALGLLRDTLPAQLYAFLTPQGGDWDTPLSGDPLAVPPVPGAQVFDARRVKPAELAAAPPPQQAALGDVPLAPLARGALSVPLAGGAGEAHGASNAWAVAGADAAGGRALLAVDMHLLLGVPNIWYRAAISWPASPAAPAGAAGAAAGAGAAPMRRMIGVTLPGVPLVVAGSNGAVAWGFTSGRFDASDVILLDLPPGGDGDTYLTPQGPRRFEHHPEVVHVRGAQDVVLDVRWTVWGPEIDPDTAGRRRAIRWVALDDEAADMGLVGLETAGGVADAMAVAWRSGIPAENFVTADAAGHIGWTIAGRLPRRVGFDGRTPTSWSDGSRRWDGLLAAADIPRLVDPPAGRVWSANNRPVGGAELARIGDGGFILGARARQIRDDLLALPRASAADMLKVQLDDRALFLARWRELLLGVLSPRALAADPRRRELRQAVETWGGRAAAASVGYRVVHDFREHAARRVFEAAVLACRQKDARFDYLDAHDQWEGPLWRLVGERPANFLDPRYRSWDDELLAVADEVLAEPRQEGVRLADWTWGRANTARIRHLLSGALPLVGRLLDMPAVPLDGDDHMPRVQAPSYGPSERIVVSPGAEEQGLFNMPGGESADPISPHYGDAQDAWVHGAPAPLLPGPPLHTLHLVPLQERGAAGAARPSRKEA